MDFIWHFILVLEVELYREHHIDYMISEEKKTCFP